MPQETSQLTVMFADVCGSTRLYEALGDEEARSRIACVLSRLAEVTIQNGGEVVKSIGDELLCTFPEAVPAVDAAMAMNRAVDEMSLSPTLKGTPVNIHTGLVRGEVVCVDEDVFGDAVNVAARLVSLAKPRQILTIRETVDQMSSSHADAARVVDRTTLKGKTGEVQVCEVPWEESGVTAVVDPESIKRILAMAMEKANLVLSLGEAEVIMGPDRPCVSLGRQPENEFSIERPPVSRYHARIEFRRGRFYLIDQSSNGTFLKRKGWNARPLLHEEAPLKDSGVIGLGEIPEPDSPWAIRYRLES